MAVNWGLGLQQGPNAGEAFANAFHQGMQQNRLSATRNAMAALMANPNDPKALGELARLDPATAMDFRKQQAEMLKTQLAQHQDSIIKGAQILRQFNPQDQAGYSQALAAAQAAGVDISQVPQQFNKEYVDGVIKVADALKPDANTQMIVTPQPGAPAFVYDRATGGLKQLFVPNDGTQTAGAPAGDMPSVASPEEAMKLPPGAQFRLPDGRIGTVPGGAGGNASGGFRTGPQ